MMKGQRRADTVNTTYGSVGYAGAQPQPGEKGLSRGI